MMAETLSAVLSGGPIGTEVGTLRDGEAPPLRISHMFLAIDPDRFVGLAEFLKRMQWFTADVKSSAPSPGYQEVLFANEPETRTEQCRLREGIPVPERLFEALARVARPLDVQLPTVWRAAQ
jgi:ureidoglycolate dehydrogenase (NAD+)